MIKLNEISKAIRGNEVLKDINLEFNKGEVVLLHGHNGSGKTMLLRLLCGLIKPTSGKVEKAADLRFGVIIENPTFFQHETAFYNLKYLASINKVISDGEIEEWLKVFNLYDKKDMKVRKFSLGMRQRLALCQAFMENPDVILLDEPFNGVDDDNMQAVYQAVEGAKAKGKLIVIASHVKISVAGLVTRSVKMSDGNGNFSK